MHQPVHSLFVGNDSDSHSRADSNIDEAFSNIVITQVELRIGRGVDVGVETILMSFGFALDMLQNREVAIGALWRRGDEPELRVSLVEAYGSKRAYADEVVGFFFEELFYLIHSGLRIRISAACHLIADGKGSNAAELIVMRHADSN